MNKLFQGVKSIHECVYDLLTTTTEILGYHLEDETKKNKGKYIKLEFKT